MTFQFGGQQVTCTVVGSSSVEFDDGTDRTSMSASTALNDTDQACQDALVQTTVNAAYLRDDDTDEETFAATSNGSFVSASAAMNGVATSLDATHTAVFQCDGTGCAATESFQTSPK